MQQGEELGEGEWEGRPKLAWEQVVMTDVTASTIDGTLLGGRGAWKVAIRRSNDPATLAGKGSN